MKKYFLIFLLLGITFAAPYTRKIGLYELSVIAPRTERKGRDVYFYSAPNKQDVLLRYDRTVIRAGEARLRPDNRIYLSHGFHSRYLNHEITGQLLEYNPNNNFMEGQDIVISTPDFYTHSKRLSFQGEKISLIQPIIGIPMYGFALKSRQLDLYPGWGVFYDTTFNLNNTPFWYIPVYVVDKRRNAFEMPGSFPEWGNTYFRGEYFRWNSHYYINEKSYGNLQASWTQEKGSGYGMQNILRFSNYDQMMYLNENWQYFPTQEKISYEHSFLKLPYSDEKQLDFNELLQYNEEVKESAANTLRLTHSVYEESGVDLIDRDIEVEYFAHYNLPWYKLNLYTINTYTSIYEITTDTEGARWQAYSELAKSYEIPYIATIYPGIGYDTTKYSLYPYSWHRVFSFVSTSKSFWIFRWRAKAYDYIDERGQSPFSFDEPFAIGDNVRTTSEVQLWNLRLGQTVRYIIYDGRIWNMIYFLEYTTRPWTIRIEHNYMEKSWWTGASASF